MTLTIRHLAVFTNLCMLSREAAAQDIYGDYTLNVGQDPGAQNCVWEGPLELIQSGGNPGRFSENAAVTSVSGP